MLHILPTNYHLLAVKQEPYPKLCLLTKNTEEFSGKSQENGQKTRQDRKSNGSRQKNEKSDSKGESNDSPEIADRGEGGRHQTSSARLRGPHYRNHCCYLTPGQPQQSPRGKTQVTTHKKKSDSRFTLHAPSWLKKNGGKCEVGGTEKVDAAKATSPTTAEANIAIL